jgi:hypothetical protein
MAPSAASVVGNWNSGVATSGAAGEDLVTIGANDTKRIIHALLVNISALTPGAAVTVRAYMQVNGVERLVYSEAFTQGTDPDGLWIMNGDTLGIHEAVRVEVYSDQAADDGAAIDYDYLVEA